MSISQRISQARKLRGLSLRAVGERAQLSHEAVRKYEVGADLPSSGVLLRLAAALEVPPAYFFRSATVGEIQPVFRKKKALTQAQLLRVEAEIRDRVERYLELESIRLPEAEPRALPEDFPVAVGSFDEVESAAERLRDAWQLGRDPIENLTDLLEEQAIKVVAIAGVDGFDACTFEVTHDGLKSVVIAVRADLPGDRHRFNLGHELAHRLLAVGPALDEEKAANRFAGAFLAPRERVLAELGAQRQSLGLVELHLLKHKYGMSMQAWIYRAKDLGVLGEDVAARQFRSFRANGWHRAEPGDALPTEEPGRFRRLILQAVEEQQISRQRASELLAQPFEDFIAAVAREHNGLVAAVGG
ncbi:MAG: ImmA/IrrE family metallo-endopeptidase [Thermoanaerobaculia bacterium]|nr:ImmA/IrrE family metallo-endopeptidase [Thermoanaerobaculia bacterium]